MVEVFGRSRLFMATAGLLVAAVLGVACNDIGGLLSGSNLGHLSGGVEPHDPGWGGGGSDSGGGSGSVGLAGGGGEGPSPAPAPDCGQLPAGKPEVAITPNSIGWVDASSNPVGIQGAWYPYADGYDNFTGLRDGTCQAAGHADSECSFISTPTVGEPFANVGGVMCAAGTADQILFVNGQPDFANMWGGGIGFDLAGSAAGGPKGVFDAGQHNVMGIAFDIDTVPSSFRVEFPTPESDATSLGADFWGANASYPNSPVVPGTNVVLFSNVVSPEAIPRPIDVSRLEGIQFHVVPNIAAGISFSYCVSNLKILLGP
jgi:hypothetical protein